MRIAIATGKMAYLIPEAFVHQFRARGYDRFLDAESRLGEHPTPISLDEAKVLADARERAERSTETLPQARKRRR